jgi:peroxiredoxin
LQKNYDKIQAEGAELIAISSDNVEETKKTTDNGSLKYLVLADNDRKTINAYNVVDPANKRIARASSFVIDLDGKITWVSLDAWNARVPTAKILTELGKL